MFMYEVEHRIAEEAILRRRYDAMLFRWKFSTDTDKNVAEPMYRN